MSLLVIDERERELVAAGSVASALDAFEQGNNLVYILAFHQTGDRLQVARAAADEFHARYFIVRRYVVNDLARTRSFRDVSLHI